MKLLLTGSTGFLGKSVLFDLLYNHYDKLEIIYLFIRHKKGKTPQQRCESLIDQFYLFFPHLDQSRHDKIKVISDISQIVELSITHTIHSAANIRFLESYNVLYKSNVEFTIDLLKTLPSNSNFIYISTAYVTNYKTKDSLPELNQETEHFKNQYQQTKSICEKKLVQECYLKNIHLRIIRPSITCCAYSFPKSGWSETITMFDSISLWYIKFNKGVFMDKSYIDIIPVDFVAKTINYYLFCNENEYGMIINAVSSKQIKMKHLRLLIEKHCNKKLKTCNNHNIYSICSKMELALIRSYTKLFVPKKQATKIRALCNMKELIYNKIVTTKHRDYFYFSPPILDEKELLGKDYTLEKYIDIAFQSALLKFKI